MIKKIKPSSPDIYLGKTIADNTLARIAHVNQLADQINNELAVVKPYKVYTALLTQSGVSQALVTSDGSLTKGVTYSFDGWGPGYDFTNLGGPKYPDTTTFVATADGIPISWGADLLFDTGAPVVTVLENTIGNVWFTYNSIGIYYIYSNNLFTSNKTYYSFLNILNADTNQKNGLQFLSENQMLIISADGETTVDDLLINTPIEIRVYN